MLQVLWHGWGGFKGKGAVFWVGFVLAHVTVSARAVVFC